MIPKSLKQEALSVVDQLIDQASAKISDKYILMDFLSTMRRVAFILTASAEQVSQKKVAFRKKDQFTSANYPGWWEVVDLIDSNGIIDSRASRDDDPGTLCDLLDYGRYLLWLDWEQQRNAQSRRALHSPLEETGKSSILS